MSFEEELARAYQWASERPSPKLGPPVGALPTGYFRCSGCRKLIPLEALRYHNTGVCMASDSLCLECDRLTPQHALIVCVRCRAVIARVAPERFSDGFSYEPRKAYHIRECGQCNPGVVSTRVIEAQLFHRSKR